MLQPFPDEFTGRNYTKIIVYSAVGVGGCLLITLILGFALHYLNISGTTARLLFASPIFSASCLKYEIQRIIWRQAYTSRMSHLSNDA